MNTTKTQTQLLQRICGFKYSVTTFTDTRLEFLNPYEDVSIVVNLQFKTIEVYKDVRSKDGTWVRTPYALTFKLFNLLSEFLLTLEE